MMRILQKVDFYVSLSPCIHLSQILGLFPVSVEDIGNTKKFSTSRKLFVYSIILLVSLLSMRCYVSVSYLQMFPLFKVNLTKQLAIIDHILTSFIGILITMFSWIKVYEVCAVLEIISKLDKLQEMNESAHLRSFFKNMVVIVPFLILLIIRVSLATPIVGYRITCFLIVSFIQFGIAAQFAGICLVIHQILLEMKIALNTIFERTLSSSQVLDIENEEIKNNMILHKVNVRQSNNNDLRADQLYLNGADSLEYLRKNYSLLCDSIQQLNCAFGFRVLLSLTHKFCEIIINLFYVLFDTSFVIDHPNNLAAFLVCFPWFLGVFIAFTLPCVLIERQVS